MLLLGLIVRVFFDNFIFRQCPNLRMALFYSNIQAPLGRNTATTTGSSRTRTTDVPDSIVDAQSISVNGLTASSGLPIDN